MKKEKRYSFSSRFYLALIEGRQCLFRGIANHYLFRHQYRAFPLINTVLLEGNLCGYANPIARF